MEQLGYVFIVGTIALAALAVGVHLHDRKHKHHG